MTTVRARSDVPSVRSSRCRPSSPVVSPAAARMKWNVLPNAQACWNALKASRLPLIPLRNPA